MTFKQTLNKMVMKTKKHSPIILTTVGIIGLGATAYTAYKARNKVEAVVIDIEEARLTDVDVDRIKVAKDLTKALWLPFTLGALSVASIIASYRVQNNRIAVLATTLAASQAQNIFFESKYKKEHGEEAYAKFMAPTDKNETVVTDDKGKERKTVEEVKKDLDKTIGQWYEDSSEYVRDDHGYNMAMIDSVTSRLETVLFARGTLLLNEVREALGFDRIRAGALLGWTSGDIFNIEKVVSVLKNEETGEFEEQIWVSWAKPRYIHDEVEFNGRYSVI